MRKLFQQEISFIKRLAQSLPTQDERDQLLKDIEHINGEERTESKHCILLHLEGYERPQYTGQHTYPFEGKVLSQDGHEITILLYADPNNRLYELEYIPWSQDEPDYIISPNWETLEIVPSPPTTGII